MNSTIYITIVYFTAFNRFMKASFEDKEPIMMYNIKRRISLICNTSVISKIETYEGHLVNVEMLDKELWAKSQIK